MRRSVTLVTPPSTLARTVLRRVAVAAICLGASLGAIPASGYAATAPAATAVAASPASAEPQFGPNVTVFDPSMTTADIQAKADAIRDLQINDEMGTARYSLMFKPGTYGTVAQPLMIQVGYYTEVVGLGRNPTDVTINGHVDVYNRCRPVSGCIALDNFWRSLSNLTINVTGGQGCRADTNFWAASQASPMRRVNIVGKLSLMDYCTDGPQYASGGFIADSRTGDVVNGSQQQYFVRNSTIGSWTNGVWNQVFSGVVGAPQECFPAVPGGCGPYTTLGETPVSREKPYLYIDAAGTYNVFAPYATTRSAGVSWANGTTPGRSIPLARFFVAKPSDSAQAIKTQLSRGMNLLLTPGVYDIDKTLMVTHSNTVVLGMGMATLTSAQGSSVMKVDDVTGVDIAGITFDAGTTNAHVLLQIGKPTAPGARGSGNKNNPTALQDVFFRIGGPHVGKADVSLEVNSNNVILDDIWAWRADHGNAGTVGWTINTAKTGVVVNGDNVTATGFFVEHYQQHNVVWNGNGGTIVFFQNELAYDPPSQAAWKESRRVNGWSALKVADSVKTFRAYGMGSYSFFNQGVDIFAENAYEVPATLAPGSLHNLLTIFLDPNKGSGGITHVVNGVGGSSTITNPGTPVTVVDYPAVPDTMPPTVAVTDDVPGATAKGDVTFTFTFSEDVGTSFTAADVAVTGGAAGTFTRVDATHATLVASPDADTTGTLQVSVATGAFTDLAGNANTVGAPRSRPTTRRRRPHPAPSPSPSTRPRPRS
ncbi:Ig-like domain-containing protein [Dermatophilaceae bacterium Soc4.6]